MALYDSQAVEDVESRSNLDFVHAFWIDPPRSKKPPALIRSTCPGLLKAG